MPAVHRTAPIPDARPIAAPGISPGRGQPHGRLLPLHPSGSAPRGQRGAGAALGQRDGDITGRGRPVPLRALRVSLPGALPCRCAADRG